PQGARRRRNSLNTCESEYSGRGSGPLVQGRIYRVPRGTRESANLLDFTVFHVEHGGRLIQGVQRRRRLGAGDEYLRSTRDQPLPHPGLMLAVQLGSEVIKSDYRPFPMTDRMEFRLGEQRDQGGQLCLPPG